MNMEFKRKLPIPKDIKEMFPISDDYAAKRLKKIKEMNEKELLNYEAPQVEIVEVEVEQGFQASGPAPIDDMPYGGGWSY